MRRRLILVAASVTTMVALAFLIPLAILVRDLARDRELTAAERDVQTIAQFLTALTPGQGLEATVSALTIGGPLSGRDLTIVLPDGTVVGTPVHPEEDLRLPLSGAASRVDLPGGVAVYAPVIQPDGSVAVVRVFAPDEALTRGVTRAWITLGLLGAFLVSLAIAVSDRLGRGLVKSVEELSDAATRLGEGELETRVRPSGPEEIEEVGRTFNRLAERIAVLLQLERETAADLSHRLRTPLTALRLDAEALPDIPGRSGLLEDLDSLERMIDHVISEARRPIRQEQAVAVDVAALVRQRAGFWGALADEQQRAWEVDVPQVPVMVRASGADLEAAVDALLGNVFAHTPEGTAFRVRLSLDGRVAEITVEDDGPGFAVADPLERGASGGGSTGLGLDIARRTAETLGGSLRLKTGPAGGASVTLQIPLDRA